MLKRPSSRRKSHSKTVELNLVPMMDCLVTMIAFLLYSMTFLALVSIESPAPILSAESNQEHIKERPLQLTLTLKEKEAEIWSPFDRINVRKIPNKADNLPNVQRIHQALVEIKKQFPLEKQIIFVPSGDFDYESLISVMDASRNLSPSDPTFYAKDAKTGADLAITSLFPDVVFGNLLGQ